MGRLKVTDIREVKRALRQKYRGIRERLDPVTKARDDKAIFDRLVSFSAYKKAQTLLCFVSTGIEVDTLALIERAFADGKQVAVPRCLDKKGTMAFFVIKSLTELQPSSFGLLEPDEQLSPKLTQFAGSVCILPGFAFDKQGYRIGFGKGYYDRFLQKYNGIKIGICYNSCIADNLPNGRYDVAANYIVTPKYIMTIT